MKEAYIMSGSQCLKPHTSCILELVPKPFFEIDNSSIWFQSRDKNFHCLELSLRWIAGFVTPPFLSNHSCPFIQLVIFRFSFVHPKVVNGLVSVTCYVSFIQSTNCIISWLTLLYGVPFVKILYLTDLAQKMLSLRIFCSLCAEIAISVQRELNVRRDSSFCAKSVRYNIFTNGAPYKGLNQEMMQRVDWNKADIPCDTLLRNSFIWVHLDISVHR